MSIAPSPSYTPEDLLALPNRKDFELVDGQLVDRNMSGLSCIVATIVNRKIGDFAEQQGLGDVFASDLGYQCFPDDPVRIRKPDGSFIRKGRLTLEQLEAGYMALAPDLAIEVLSPNDLSYEIGPKIEEYLAAGVQLVWILNPQTRIVWVHRLDGTVAKLHARDELSGEDVLPGFSCPVGTLFDSGVR